MRSYIEAEKTLGNRQSRKLQNNTYLQRRTPTSIAVKLNNTDIITYHSDGRVVLNSGGYRTVTTKARINDYSPQYVSQEKSVWYLGREDTLRIFEDGIVINADGSISGGREVVGNEDQKVIRQCAKYAKDFVEAMDKGKVDKPSMGDCWYCCMRVQPEGSEGVKTGVLHNDGTLHNTATCKAGMSGKTLGEMNSNNDHIKSHMEEKYYVPSLLVRAIEVFPVSRVARWWVDMCWTGLIQESSTMDRIGKNQVRKSIYRYVKRQMGYAS